MAEEVPQIVLCPYCGHTQRLPADRCDDCGGFFDPLSRRVSQQHMGPWFIRNSKQPFCPGCSYDMLMRQIERGRITPNTIMRGPTTKQFWSVARNVPGVAHHLGVCHGCNARVEKTDAACGKCGAVFLEARKRDKLGLDRDDPGVFEEARLAAASPAAGVVPPAAPSTSPAAAPAPAPAPDAASPPPARAKVVSTTSTARVVPPSAAPASPPPVPSPLPPRTVAVPAARVDEEVSWMGDGGDQQGEDVLEEEVATRGGGHLWIWVLVGLNLALLAAVVFFLFFHSSEAAAPSM